MPRGIAGVKGSRDGCFGTAAIDKTHGSCVVIKLMCP